MHVLLLDFTFFEYTIQLANALSQLCQVTLALPDSASRQCALGLKRTVGLHLFHLPRLRYPTNLLMVNHLFRLVAQTRPQVVHQLAWHLWMNLALPVFPNVPFVTTIHDASQHPGDRASIMAFQDWQWQRADQVIVHAEAVKRQLVEEHHIPQEKVQVIPLGAYQFYRDVTSATVQEKAHTILFFGRIWGYKGLQYLIEAEPLITQQVPDARIVIAGEGESFEKYERLMQHRDHFIVHNYSIPDEMVAQLFQEASVVALPYIEASQSAVLSIAYAFGKPVVATAVGGIPEVVQNGETGYLVPPRDSRSLAKAIVTLLKDPAERARLGRNALAAAQSVLSWSGIAARTLQVYQQAVAIHTASH